MHCYCIMPSLCFCSALLTSPAVAQAPPPIRQALHHHHHHLRSTQSVVATCPWLEPISVLDCRDYYPHLAGYNHSLCAEACPITSSYIPCEVCTLLPVSTASSSFSSASSSVDGPGTVVGRRTAISEVTTYPGPVVLTAQPNFLRRDNDPIAFLYCGCGCIFQSGYS